MAQLFLAWFFLFSPYPCTPPVASTTFYTSLDLFPLSIPSTLPPTPDSSPSHWKGIQSKEEQEAPLAFWKTPPSPLICALSSTLHTTSLPPLQPHTRSPSPIASTSTSTFSVGTSGVNRRSIKEENNFILDTRLSRK